MNNCDFISISDIEIDFSSENAEELPNTSSDKNNGKSEDTKINKSSKQKKRPPRKPVQKINILESLDFDKLMDGIENEETEKSTPIKNQSPKKEKNTKTKNIEKDKKIDFFPIDIGLKVESTPLQSFENNILNYLQSTTKDLIPIFLAELKYNIERSLDYDRQIHDFLSQLRIDIEMLINEQSSIINTELSKSRDYFNFNFYFDELTLPNHSTHQNSSENKYVQKGCDFLITTDKIIKDLQTSKEKILGNSLSKLKELKSESNQLKNLLNKCSKSDENKKKISNARCAVEKEQMVLEFYEKQIQEVCNRQSKLRNHFQTLFEYQHKSFQLNNNENDDNEDYIYIKDDLMDLFKQIKFNQNKINQKKIRKSDLEKLNMNYASIKSDIQDIYEKSKNIQYSQSRNIQNQSKSFQVSTILNTPISSTDYYSGNHSYLMNTSSNPLNTSKIRSNNLVVTNIRKRLENVQKISRENNYLLANM